MGHRNLLATSFVDIIQINNYNYSCFRLTFTLPEKTIKVVRNKKSNFFSHRCLIEFYETNRMSHVPHLYDVVNLLK